PARSFSPTTSSPGSPLTSSGTTPVCAGLSPSGDISWFVIVKGWHAAEFAILFLLAYALLKRYDPKAFPRNLIRATALSLLFAITDEYHQAFVPGRGGTWSDVAIDGLGVVLAASIVWLRGNRPNPRLQRTRCAGR